MKRLTLVAFLVALLAPAGAHAAAPCRDRIYNDWYPDGKIATTYPIACYRDALKHVKDHQDALIYSSLSDDIRSAMQAALQRQHGQDVPAAVGKGGKGGVSPAVTTLPNGSGGGTKTDAGGGNGSQSVDQTTTIAAPPASSNGGGGIPTPILVLGALALLLVAVGAAGAGAKRFRRPPPTA